MAPRINYEDSGEQIRRLFDRVDAARNARDTEARLGAYRTLLEHQRADHQVIDHEVLDEVHRVLRRPHRHSPSDSPSPLDGIKRRCDHCGFDPDRPPLSARIPGRPLPSPRPTRVALSPAWFPAARTGRAIAWPPARNDACWCESGRTYKKCCGPVPPADDSDR